MTYLHSTTFPPDRRPTLPANETCHVIPCICLLGILLRFSPGKRKIPAPDQQVGAERRAGDLAAVAAVA